MATLRFCDLEIDDFFTLIRDGLESALCQKKTEYRAFSFDIGNYLIMGQSELMTPEHPVQKVAFQRRFLARACFEFKMRKIGKPGTKSRKRF